jgi:hypothetical protein
MNPITIPNITIPVIGLPTIGIPSVGFPSASGGGLAWPKGLKESIKAIYDPASQGMTNYDVIEAYAEDFTNWTLDNSNGIATVTKNEIHITESIVYYRSVVRQDKVRGTQPFKVLISGLTDSQAVQYIYNDGKSYVTKKLTTNGVHELPASSAQRNGFNVEPAGACDVTITQLPTSILKDLSGNGNHAYLYGGKGKLNSGMGVYQEDFTTFNKNDNVATYENVSSNICHIIEFKSTIAFLYKSTGTKINSITVKISGNFNGTTIVWQYYLNDKLNSIDISEPGIYTLPGSDGTGRTSGFYNRVAVGKVDITITQIPDYPNQLCYDGKMYAVCYGFPILEDYTVMADRTWFENEGNRVFITKGNIWPNCAFVFEKINASLGSETFSFSKSTNIDDLIGKSGITYQTKQSYNGKIIGVGTSSDGDILLIGGQLKGGYIGCHGKIIIADRSFTEGEITWLKDNWKKI